MQVTNLLNLNNTVEKTQITPKLEYSVEMFPTLFCEVAYIIIIYNGLMAMTRNRSVIPQLLETEAKQANDNRSQLFENQEYT